MKLIIASDIHGSYKYTKKLEELITSFNPDKIILLGDLLYNWSSNKQDYDYEGVYNILNKYSNKIISVKGNCDSYEDDLVCNFSLKEEIVELEIDGLKFYLTHGHLNNKYNFLFKDNYLLYGHTHLYNLEGKHLNPGSVGLPRMGKGHTCLIYENKVFKLINLDNFSVIAEKTI